MLCAGSSKGAKTHRELHFSESEDCRRRPADIPRNLARLSSRLLGHEIMVSGCAPGTTKGYGRGWSNRRCAAKRTIPTRLHANSGRYDIDSWSDMCV